MQLNNIRNVLWLLIAAFGISVAPAANACFTELTRDDLIHRFHYEVEKKLEVSLNEDGLAGISQPKITYLRPLGEDCSGLSFAFYITKYRFTIRHSGIICEHDGVILLKGTLPNAPIEVQDDKRCPANEPAPAPPIESWSGSWINEADSGALKRLLIDTRTRRVSAFGFCGDGECDWGSRPFEITEGSQSFSVDYPQSNGTVTLNVRNLRERLQVQYLKRFNEGSGGQVMELTEYFKLQ